MQALITGLNGTVAPVLASALTMSEHTVIPWDRSIIPIDDSDTAYEFIERENPDWFFHIATGSPDWAEMVAGICSELTIKFLFTSSVSVFSGDQSGPLTPDILPQPRDDYGRYKLECEQRIRAANPGALIVRLGWQIGTMPGGNHMVDYLERQFREEGVIQASTHWYQACSFLQDTATSLVHAMENLSQGVYHLDANPGLNFYEIVNGLNMLQNNRWSITPGKTPTLNNMMKDNRLPISPITNHFQNHR